MDESVEKTAPKENFWKELITLVLFAVIIVVPFRLYIAQPFIVDGASMDPTFEDGEYLIVDELSYHFKAPERGSVLIFKYPKDPKKYFIKRVIGLPGETITIDEGKVSVTQGTTLTLEEPYVSFPKNESLSYTLAEGEYFVMGDNRRQSSDSRLWGPVSEDHIIGRPVLRFLPPALWPGHVDYELSSDAL